MPTMTEAEAMAADTWEKMFKWSMPAYAALDRVQDVTDDREQAMKMILEACADYFEALQPKKRHRYQGVHAKSILIGIRLKRLVQAESLRETNVFAEAGSSRQTGNDWLSWFHELRRGIRLCTELVEEWASGMTEAVEKPA